MMSEAKNHRRQPVSLGDQVVPDDRDALIRAHTEMLSLTAREVSDTLAFDADTADIIAVLESEPDDASEVRS